MERPVELRIDDYYFEFLQFNPTSLTVYRILEKSQGS